VKVADGETFDRSPERIRPCSRHGELLPKSLSSRVSALSICLITGPLIRPIDVRFHPQDETLYIVDLGYFEMDAEKGVTATAFSGKLWRLKLSED
jgi:hypothetical protein